MKLKFPEHSARELFYCMPAVVFTMLFTIFEVNLEDTLHSP